jgi:hypothetical protein
VNIKDGQGRTLREKVPLLYLFSQTNAPGCDTSRFPNPQPIPRSTSLPGMPPVTAEHPESIQSGEPEIAYLEEFLFSLGD